MFVWRTPPNRHIGFTLNFYRPHIYSWFTQEGKKPMNITAIRHMLLSLLGLQLQLGFVTYRTPQGDDERLQEKIMNPTCLMPNSPCFIVFTHVLRPNLWKFRGNPSSHHSHLPPLRDFGLPFNWYSLHHCTSLTNIVSSQLDLAMSMLSNHVAPGQS